MLCSCASRYEEVSGSWSSTLKDTPEQARALLEHIDAYEEEIAAADLDSLEYVKTVTFDMEKQYRFGYDVEATRQCVRNFYDGFFNDLYEARTTLNDAYGMDFDAMSKEDFLLFYAEIYGYSTYAELLDDLVENSYDFEELSKPTEVGTYSFEGNRIMCTILGDTQAESLIYAIDGDELTLTYSNAVEVYTRAG